MSRVTAASECLIRLAAPADMAAVTRIYTHFVETSTATFELVAPGEATMQRRRQAVIDAGQGGNFIDTANGHTRGHSEKSSGTSFVRARANATARYRDQIFREPLRRRF